MDKDKSYKILAEYYMDDELISYIVINSNGKVMEVKKEELVKWN